MLEFKPVELSDKEWIAPIVAAEDSPSADYNFGNIFMWDHAYHQLVARTGDRLVVSPRYDVENPFFVFPIGSGDLASAVSDVAEYARERELPLIFRGVSEKHVSQLETAFPGRFEFIEEPDCADYVYSAEKLVTLAGKKLHGKRNHINRFIEDNNWRFEELTLDKTTACMDMLAQWTLENLEQMDDGVYEEHMAIEQAFKYYDELGLEGGTLYSGDRLIAFTIGEKISSNTFNVHFEKAFSDIQGAYPMVNREFVRQIRAKHPEIEYINREDDMGKENLRQAKLSYYPDLMVRKFTARWI